MGWGVPEAWQQCYNSSMNSDLTVPRRRTRTTTNCHTADSRSDPRWGSDNNIVHASSLLSPSKGKGLMKPHQITTTRPVCFCCDAEKKQFLTALQSYCKHKSDCKIPVAEFKVTITGQGWNMEDLTRSTSSASSFSLSRSFSALRVSSSWWWWW